MRQPRAKPDAIDDFADAIVPLAAFNLGEAKRELDVFLEGHARQQIESLEDDADRMRAMLGPTLQKSSPRDYDRVQRSRRR